MIHTERDALNPTLYIQIEPSQRVSILTSILWMHYILDPGRTLLHLLAT